MKVKVFKLSYLSLLLAVVAFASCRKEMIEPIKEQTEEITGETGDVSMVASEVDQVFLSDVVVGGTESEPLESPNAGLPEEYLLESSSFEESESSPNHSQAKLIRCLKAQDLSERQIAALRKAFTAYHDCKADAIKRHRAAYEALQKKVEAARLEMIKKYRNKEISKEEFEKGMKNLRIRFEEALKKIKESYAQSLKACFEKFLSTIKGILTEAQWKAFLKCYRG